MRKMAVIVVATIATVGMWNAQTGAQQQPAGTIPPVEKTTNARLAGETIDGIEVPHDILTAVQLYFQGFAVTQAHEIERAGKKAYRLQVGSNSVANDADSFYLNFDDKWKFITQEKFILPPKPTVETIQPDQDDKPETQTPENDKPEEARNDPNPTLEEPTQDGDNDLVSNDEPVVREQDDRRRR